MKKIILWNILIMCYSFSFAQNEKGSANDIARITLAAFVPQQIDKMPDAARSILANKLSQIVTQNGMGGSAYNQRFIITTNVNVISKDLTPTAPAMTAFVLEVTLFIGDGIEGTKFSSTSIIVKGAGENETKAYISAIKKISPSNISIQSFVENGKLKIIEYYNSKCDFIIKEGQTLTSQNKFDEAIATLTNVPEVCKGCYDKAMDAVGPIYQKQIDRDCKIKLQEANTNWNASQDTYGADIAGQFLVQIDPNAACYKEALALSNKIAQRVKEIDQRDWKFQLKEQQDDIDLKNAIIKAARDIGVAYGNGPKATIVKYNIIGWW
ncbi:hypothetical protein SAMN05444372_103270 [Flavobacterium micromati]|uniref:Uncharacterized protein n=1 Tax=Flavobacterium micromati TaxID=229205 RepID=A0A1M5I3S4_9FLAO|nr:hypothetical protein [Flavobacterium micromati]MCL6461645.1 hypothetical protein [Flavobacterium micromati]SHG22936.1 hypothetical protein SAMN05444372_103270 [Flavobacterium micromati]